MSPRVLLAGSLAFSLLFNLVWAFRDGVDTPAGWLSVGAAVACTLIVPAGLGLWPQIPARGAWARFFRAVLMLGISAAAAVTSFSHSVDVLRSVGWTDWTAGAVTAGIELLVALSTMALRAAEQVTGQAEADRTKVLEQALSDALAKSEQGLSDSLRGGGQGTEQPDEQPANTPVPTRPNLSQTGPDRPDTPGDSTVHELANTHPDRLSDFRKWMSERGGVMPSGKAIRDRYGCGYAAATNLVKAYERVLAEQHTATSEPTDEEVDREVVLSS